MARTFFVLVLPYGADRRILAERTFSYNDITWSLLGGSLRQDQAENFIQAASRLAEFNLPSLNLADIEPIAILKNTFAHAKTRAVHRGIAFVARIRSEDIDREIRQAVRTRGHMIATDTDSRLLALRHNAEVFKVASEYLGRKALDKVPFYEQEINVNEQFKRRYQFHDSFVKPVLRIAGRFGFQNTLDQLDQTILGLILEERPRSFVDVACGENQLCVDLATNGHVPIVVGNDVSWSQIELMSGRVAGPKNKRSALLFTNHDATQMPFRDEMFDVAICKNVRRLTRPSRS